jgi:leucyl aminopeptidase
MIDIKLSTKKFSETKSAGYAWMVEEGFAFDKSLQAIAEEYFPNLQALFKERNFTGKAGSRLMVHGTQGKSICHLIFVGLGKQTHKKLDIEQYRRALGSLVRSAQSHKISSLAFELPAPQLFATTFEHFMQQTVTIATMADYYFDDFKPEKRSDQLLTLHISVTSAQQAKAKAALEMGEIIGKAVNSTRHWIDMPPSRMTPTVLADNAAKIAKKHDLKLTVFSEKEIIKMGMGGLAAVSAGSNQDAKFIILEYKAKKNAPTIALVGKGITFDSGGLQIKPSQSMATMKEDMSGAASVINAIAALAELKAPVNIIALAPSSENLPSGTATKPGDIVTFYNGKTAEVAHTDAEGRLILADALSYAVKHFKPDLIVDVATLTGACDYAVGPFYAGLFTMDDALAQRMLSAADAAGERIWRLPLHNDYEAAFKSEVAEIMNDRKANYRAGATVGAMFLKHFVGDCPWVHLDIASNAFDVPGVSYTESGATGSSVRLLIELVMNWKN